MLMSFQSRIRNDLVIPALRRGPESKIVLALCLLLPASLANAALPAVLPDGFLISGLDGELRQTAGGTYAFVFDKAVSTDKGSIKAGQEVGLLPSTTLEYMLRDMGASPSMSVRLWGTVTLFHSRNYIFPSYHLRVSAPTPPAQPEPAAPAEPNVPVVKPADVPAINDPNDEIRIPEELMTELKATRRVIDAAPAPEPTPPAAPETTPAAPLETADVMVVDRYGILTHAGGDSWTLKFDGLGRNVSLISFGLLPCEVLQRMEADRKPSDLEPRRYRIAGVITRFKGDYYMLPARVVRAYDYGNFAQ
jgi:hypothetical protein